MRRSLVPGIPAHAVRAVATLGLTVLVCTACGGSSRPTSYRSDPYKDLPYSREHAARERAREEAANRAADARYSTCGADGRASNSTSALCGDALVPSRRPRTREEAREHEKCLRTKGRWEYCE